MNGFERGAFIKLVLKITHTRDEHNVPYTKEKGHL